MTAANGLSVGQRAPDFVGPDEDGRVVSFYEVWCGRPLLMVLCRDPDRVAATPRLLDWIEALELDLVVLREGDGPARPAGPVITDRGGLAQVLAGGWPAAADLLLFDATLRLACRVPAAEASLDLLEEALEAAAAAVDAPVLRVPSVLDPDLCRALIAAHDAAHVPSPVFALVDGRPAPVVDPARKSRTDHLLREPALSARVVTALQARLLPEVEKAFAWRAERYETPKVVRYDAGAGWFRAHRDNATPDTAHRRFAVTLGLHDAAAGGGYEGGALRFPEYGPRLYRPAAGEALVFACAHLHELTDVTAGRRYALLTFL